MANKKDIELVIRARDEYSRALNKAKSSVERFARAQKATQSRRDFLGNARAEAQAAGAAYRQAGADAAKYGQALTRATANGERLTGTNRKLARAFIEARNAARASRTAMEGQTTSLAAATGGFAAFSRRVDRTTISLKNQTAAARAAGVANRGALGGGGGRGRGGAGANGREADEIKRLSSAKGRGILGLRPYELQNLSYQINDIVTGLVSGQKPMQVFAQQGGQIVQLFQRQALAFARSPLAPVILAATVALAPFVAAVTRLREETVEP